MYPYSKFLLSLLCLGTLTLTASCGTTTSDSTTKSQPTSQPTSVVGKLGSVGGPLAKELQGKPVLVDVFASWCPGCKNIAPTLTELKKEYANKVNFVVLDVSDPAKTKETEALAKKLGLSKFLTDNKSKTSTVAIVNPETGDILTMFANNPNKSDYTKVIDTALAKK
jgi:thiol-disulfide isomerase/thioredoxin